MQENWFGVMRQVIGYIFILSTLTVEMIKIVKLEHRYGRNEKANKPDDQHNENGLLKFAFQAQRKHDGQVPVDGDVGEDEDGQLGG